MRIVIDTNIWIHYLIRSSHKLLDSLITNPETEIVLSKELLDELLEVSTRKKFASFFTPVDAAELVMLLESRFPPLEVLSNVNACRDPKDNFLLALAKDGNVDYLITGDADLLVLKKFEMTTILSLTEFERLFE
jgi:putative PIN family toxin of toxin-antitoxin system